MRGYHGVGFGGTSVGGIVGNRKIYGSLLAGVDHIPATYDREKQAFTLEEAVKMLTCDNATQFGLHDRGLLREAWPPTSWCSIPTRSGRACPRS